MMPKTFVGIATCLVLLFFVVGCGLTNKAGVSQKTVRPASIPAVTSPQAGAVGATQQASAQCSLIADKYVLPVNMQNKYYLSASPYTKCDILSQQVARNSVPNLERVVSTDGKGIVSDIITHRTTGIFDIWAVCGQCATAKLQVTVTAPSGTAPSSDFDNDGIADDQDSDDDNDGFSDVEEQQRGTDPRNAQSFPVMKPDCLSGPTPSTAGDCEGRTGCGSGNLCYFMPNSGGLGSASCYCYATQPVGSKDCRVAITKPCYAGQMCAYTDYCSPNTVAYMMTWIHPNGVEGGGSGGGSINGDACYSGHGGAGRLSESGTWTARITCWFRDGTSMSAQDTVAVS